MDGAINYFYGDAWRLTGLATEGNDTIIGGNLDAINWIYGDANTMLALAAGGNDTIVGGLSAENHLYGDAHTMGANNKGGADILKIGNRLTISLSEDDQTFLVSNNSLYGDADVTGLLATDFIFYSPA